MFVGASGVIVVTVIGFTCGVLFPGRFTAPLVAIGVLVLYQTGLRQALGVTASSGTYALLSPANGPPVVDTGVYYHVAPDLSIVQVMFMGGIAVALFGVLGLAPALRELASAAALPPSPGATAGCFARSRSSWSHAAWRRPGPRSRWPGPRSRTRLAGGRSRRCTPRPAIEPVPVTQDCTSSSGFQVCVHPAFSFYLHDLAAAFEPVAAEIAGLPGAPAGAREVASVSGGQDVQSGTSVSPPVFEFTAEHVGAMFGQFNGIPDPAGWASGFQQGLLDAFLTGRPPHAGPVPILLGPAQQAVEDALLTAVRSQPLRSRQLTSAGVSAAAHRFAALSASARHAWLAAHLAALRAGTITLAQIP